MRNVSENSCRENQNTHFMFNNPFSKIVCEIMWKNMVQPDKQMKSTQQCMYFACWITKATDTHSEYEISFSMATMVA
jgi:hypothetical protein